MPPKKNTSSSKKMVDFDFGDEDEIDISNIGSDINGNSEVFNKTYKDGVRATWVNTIEDSTVYTEVGDEEINFDPTAMDLSRPQREHMERLIRIFSYSNAAIDTSSTGAGKSYVALSLFKELGFDYIRVFCPLALKDTWYGHFVRAGLGDFNEDGDFDPIMITCTYEDLFYKKVGRGESLRYVLVTKKIKKNIPIAGVMTYPDLMNKHYKNVGNGKKPRGFSRIIDGYTDTSADLFFNSPIYELPDGSEKANDVGLDEDEDYYRIPEMLYHFDVIDVEKRNLPKTAPRDAVYYNSVSDSMRSLSMKGFLVVDESQKAKNNTSTSAMLGGKLSTVLYPKLYRDLHRDMENGTHDRILFLSATPFDKYEHVYSYLRLLGFSPYLRMATFGKDGRQSISYPDGYYEVRENIINFVKRCAAIFPEDYKVQWSTSIYNDQILSNDLDLNDTRMVNLHSDDLIPLIENMFKDYSTAGAHKNLFRIYVGYLKHVISSYVPKPAMRGQKRYLANLFIDVDYNSASAAIFEAYLYSTLKSRAEQNGVNRISAMAESQTFRRNVSCIKAHSVGTMVREILDNTIQDKVLVFVSEDYPQEWIMKYINDGGVDKKGKKYENLTWAVEIRGEGKYEDAAGKVQRHIKEDDTRNINKFQEDNNELRCIVAKLSMASVGISLHDLHGTHPRHTFIIPDSDLTNVAQSIGRTIRVGMKSSAAVYIVYTGSCRKGEAPKDEGIDYKPLNFIEINRVYNNLYTKTKIMALSLQGTDMDFPGDFVSLKESGLQGNFYDWSRKELIEEKGMDESEVIPSEEIPREKEKTRQLIYDLYYKKEGDRNSGKVAGDIIYYDYDYHLHYGDNDVEVVPQGLINTGKVHSPYYHLNRTKGILYDKMPNFRLDKDYTPPSSKESGNSSSSSAKSSSSRKPSGSSKPKSSESTANKTFRDSIFKRQ